jgi:hypothetical protein
VGTYKPCFDESHVGHMTWEDHDHKIYVPFKPQMASQDREKGWACSCARDGHTRIMLRVT